MNKQKNNQKGITLIALVITIVVLVILVGVTVSTAINTGLIANSKKAVGDYEEKQKEEEDGISIIEAEMDFLNSPNEIKISTGSIKGADNIDNVNEKYITGVQLEGKDAETVSSFEARLPQNKGYEVWASLDATESASDDTVIATGMILKKEDVVIGTIIVFGDIHNNGKLNAFDGTYLVQALNRSTTRTFTKAQIQAMDVNHDGIVNGLDLNVLKKKVATPSRELIQSANTFKDIKIRYKDEVVNGYLTEEFKTNYNFNIDSEASITEKYTITVGSTVTAGELLTKIGDTTSRVSILKEDGTTEDITEKTSEKVVTNGSKLYLGVVNDGYAQLDAESDQSIEINIVVE